MRHPFHSRLPHWRSQAALVVGSLVQLASGCNPEDYASPLNLEVGEVGTVVAAVHDGQSFPYEVRLRARGRVGGGESRLSRG